MNELGERMTQFVNHLRSLARSGQEDRGALADLRSGLGSEPGHAPRMHKHVVPYLGERESAADRWFYVAGAMFGAHSEHAQGNTMGKCFRQLRENGSESMEGRFAALIAAHPNDLPKHLAHAVGMLKSKDIRLDYYRLLSDLMSWSDPERRVQNRWARDFYRRTDNTEQGGNEVE